MPTDPRPSHDEEVSLLASLLHEQPAIPFTLLYDELGSRLFAAITSLEEYYPTRTEAAILAQHVPAMLEARPVGGAVMIDLGAGNCEKAASLFARVQPSRYVAVDVSEQFLVAALADLRRRHPSIEMQAVGLDFSDRLELPASVPGGRRLFFYPGSSIGNFAPAAAVRLLASVREHMGAEDTLWIGVDLHKDKAVLERAYDDELGVTAAFMLNALRHANRVAGANFALGDWRYRAWYDEHARRVTMHVEAVREVVVRWDCGERTFSPGDRIHVEDSYKHTPESFSELLGRAGLRTVGCWTDPRHWFGFFVAAPS